MSIATTKDTTLRFAEESEGILVHNCVASKVNFLSCTLKSQVPY